MKHFLKMIVVVALVGCAPGVPDTAKEESECPYCKKKFPSVQILVHKSNCPENPAKE